MEIKRLQGQKTRIKNLPALKTQTRKMMELTTKTRAEPRLKMITRFNLTLKTTKDKMTRIKKKVLRKLKIRNLNSQITKKFLRLKSMITMSRPEQKTKKSLIQITIQELLRKLNRKLRIKKIMMMTINP